MRGTEVPLLWFRRLVHRQQVLRPHPLWMAYQMAHPEVPNWPGLQVIQARQIQAVLRIPLRPKLTPPT